MKSRLIFAIAILTLITTPLLATNGYFLHGQGTASKSMAGAGSALPQDALAATNNPAGIAFLGNQYFAALALFNPNRSYTIAGNPSGMQGTFGLTPGTVESESKMFVMPSMAGLWTPTDDSAFALSFLSHGGMNTDYRTNTFYGSNHTGVDLQQMFLNATYAKRFGQNHSFGVTGIFAFQRFEAQGLEAFGMFSSDPEHLTNNAHDNSWGYGFKVGYLGKLTPRLSVSASISPKIDMSDFNEYSGLFADGGSFDIPKNAQVGFAYKATDALTFAFDAQEIYYSGVDAVGNHLFPNMAQAQLGGTSGAGFGWDDMTVYKAGAQWEATPNWTWRAGYSKSDSPIPESEVLFNILAPGVIDDHVTAGFSRALRGNSSFNFALMYAIENSVKGANPMEVPGQQTIELTMDEWEAEMSWSMRF